MKVNLWATLPHYFAHMKPIFDALPEHLKGECVLAPSGTIPTWVNPVVMVAGWQDVRALRGRARMIYVEHGAGQTYGGTDERLMDQPGFSGHGGHRHQGVLGYICPGEAVADRWKTAPSVAVGCPKMDEHLIREPLYDRQHPAICFAWHWDSLLCAETRSAFAHYETRMWQISGYLRSRGFTVYGHAHPRWNGKLNSLMQSLGYNVLETDKEVFQNASILACDNSSLAYEFASLGRPVISLNAPYYRKGVEHGLRFWSHVPGIQVDGPDDLLAIDPWEILMDDPGRTQREAAVAYVYSHIDGRASDRAAQWIDQLLSEM